MKSALYEVVPNPFQCWDVREVRREGTLRTFKLKEEAETYLRALSATEPEEGPAVVDIRTGETLSNGAN